MEKYEVHGLQELNRALEKLPVNIHRNILNAAVRAGGQVVRKAALSELGGDKTDIVLKKRRSKTLSSRYSVAVSNQKFYLMYREFGVAGHTIKPKNKKALGDRQTGEFFGGEVQHPGQPAQPFLRPALDNNINRILEEMRKKIAARLAKEAQKAAASAGVKRLR